VGLKPEPRRNSSTRAIECSLNVLAIGGIKAICSYIVNEKEIGNFQYHWIKELHPWTSIRSASGSSN
jgi:hypothetical protein